MLAVFLNGNRKKYMSACFVKLFLQRGMCDLVQVDP